MEARGYRGGEGRTKYRQLSWGMADSFHLVIFAVLTILLLLLRS